MTNYDRQEAAREAAHKKFQQESAQGLALYGYDVQTGITTPYPSEQELQYALTTIRLEKLKMAASVLDKLTNSSMQKKSSCGCSGNKASAVRYETKSITSSCKQTKNHFAKHFERVACEAQDRAYEAFMQTCDTYLK